MPCTRCLLSTYALLTVTLAVPSPLQGSSFLNVRNQPTQERDTEDISATPVKDDILEPRWLNLYDTLSTAAASLPLISNGFDEDDREQPRTTDMVATTTATSAAGSLPSTTAQSSAVRLKQGEVIGASNNGIKSYLGIPYAQPPVQDLRLRPPKAWTETYSGGTLFATQTPRPCPQFYKPPVTTGLDEKSLLFLASSSPSGTDAGIEDCLTLNIHRPDIDTDQKLPVLFYIFGGGFEFGSSNSLDPTSLLKMSSETLKLPIMLVTINYRVGGWGFLAGKELAKDRSTNLGLRDQRLALEWVHENIEAFGGDPDQVTIWGQSAGAISVMHQTIIHSGTNSEGDKLFAGAIMDSGSIIQAATSDSEAPQAVFDHVTDVAGCTDQADKLACLRGLSVEEFTAAVNSVPNIFDYQSVDLAYLPRPDGDDNDGFFSQSPDAAIRAGNVARVPVLASSEEDEGSLFVLAQSNITTKADIVSYLHTVFFPSTDTGTITQLVDLYSLDEETPGPNPDPNAPGSSSSNISKILATILGDATFTLMRRAYLSAITTAGVQAWSFYDAHMGLDPSIKLGTFHGSEMPLIFSGQQTPSQVVPSDNMARDLQERYIRFVHFGDPNKNKEEGRDGAEAELVEWPRYEEGEKLMLQYTATAGAGSVTVTTTRDDFRSAAYNVLMASPTAFMI